MSFFHHGAKTVLGTFNAIDAKHSSIFISRLLYRLTSHFMAPVLSKWTLTWDTVVHGLQQMQFCTDLINNAITHLKINPERKKSLGFFANQLINPLKSDWFEVLIEKIAEEANLTVEQVEDVLIHKNYSYSEACSYVQIGFPELISIVEG